MSRLNFEFTDEAIEQLDKLKKKLGVTSRAEAVRYALGLLNWSAKQAEEGNYIIAVNSGTSRVKELSIPPLDELRSRATTDVSSGSIIAVPKISKRRGGKTVRPGTAKLKIRGRKASVKVFKDIA